MSAMSVRTWGIATWVQRADSMSDFAKSPPVNSGDSAAKEVFNTEKKVRTTEDTEKQRSFGAQRSSTMRFRVKRPYFLRVLRGPHLLLRVNFAF
jgi:hypothetical protein